MILTSTNKHLSVNSHNCARDVYCLWFHLSSFQRLSVVVIYDDSIAIDGVIILNIDRLIDLSPPTKVRAQSVA